MIFHQGLQKWLHWVYVIICATFTITMRIMYLIQATLVLSPFLNTPIFRSHSGLQPIQIIFIRHKLLPRLGASHIRHPSLSLLSNLPCPTSWYLRANIRPSTSIYTVPRTRLLAHPSGQFAYYVAPLYVDCLGFVRLCKYQRGSSFASVLSSILHKLPRYWYVFSVIPGCPSYALYSCLLSINSIGRHLSKSCSKRCQLRSSFRNEARHVGLSSMAFATKSNLLLHIPLPLRGAFLLVYDLRFVYVPGFQPILFSPFHLINSPQLMTPCHWSYITPILTYSHKFLLN